MTPGEQQAVAWITDYIGRRLEIAPSSMPVDVPFTELGIDSTFAVVMSGDIAAWTGREFPPNLLYEHPTIGELARHISEGSAL